MKMRHAETTNLFCGTLCFWVFRVGKISLKLIGLCNVVEFIFIDDGAEESVENLVIPVALRTLVQPVKLVKRAVQILNMINCHRRIVNCYFTQHSQSPSHQTKLTRCLSFRVLTTKWITLFSSLVPLFYGQELRGI